MGWYIWLQLCKLIWRCCVWLNSKVASGGEEVVIHYLCRTQILFSLTSHICYCHFTKTHIWNQEPCQTLTTCFMLINMSVLQATRHYNQNVSQLLHLFSTTRAQYLSVDQTALTFGLNINYPQKQDSKLFMWPADLLSGVARFCLD